jgi:hypothetical protein
VWEGHTKGPKAKPRTYNDRVEIVTSVLTPDSSAICSKVGGKDDDAKEAPMVVKNTRPVTNIFLPTGQILEFAGSSSESHVTILSG